MAETMSVRAILSAVDKGFTATMNSARKTVGNLGKTVKSGIGFGILTGAGMSAFNALENGARALVSEINESSAAWKTFEDNMSYIGKSDGEIASVKSELQKFAQQTVFSSSEMASTYSQLEAVGVGAMQSLQNGTTGLVKGFGGLAAAAQNPKQAMKTLSMQATQMAGRPKVAWKDFNLMLDQTPAGIAAVAKEMGMSTQELVAAVQEGEVKTEDFFAAIEKAGNSSAFSKMATEAKTVGQALDGLKETLGNKLGPAFEVLSATGIRAIEEISDCIAKIDGEGLADRVSAGIKIMQPYFKTAKTVVMAFGSAVLKVGGFLGEHAAVISKVVPVLLALIGAYKAFKIVSAIVPAVSGFTKHISKLASGGIGSLGGKLMKTASGMETVGKKSAASSKQMMASATAFAILGGAVLLIALGFGILAQSAIALAGAGGGAIAVMFGLVAALAALGLGMTIVLKSIASVGASAIPAAAAMLLLGAAVLVIAVGFAVLANAAIVLANAGGVAIGVFFGMIVAIGALLVVAAAVGPALTAGAVGFIAFGAAVLLVGVGALFAAAALAIVAGVLPTVCAYGFQGAAAIALLGAGMIVFAAGAMIAGAACIVLGAGILVLSAALMIAAVAVTLLGTGMLLLGAGAMLAGTGVMMLASSLPMIASFGKQAAKALLLLGAALLTFTGGAATAAVGATALAAGVMILAAGVVVLGAGLLICSAAFLLLAAFLPIVAAGSTLLASSFTTLLATTTGLSALLIALAAAIVAFAAGAVAATAGIIAFGAGMMASAVGVLAMSVALRGVDSKMKSIAGSAKSVQGSFRTMQSSAMAVAVALKALASSAKSAMNQVTSSMNSAASKAQSAGKKLGTGFTNGMKSGLAPAPSVASQTISAIDAAFRAGYGRAYSSGAYIGQGLANGMRSMLGTIRSIANQMVNEANRAIEARARIGSPSKITTQYGKWYGEGYVNGIDSMVRKAAEAAEALVSFPVIGNLNPSMAFGGELSADYDYYRKAEFVIDVPLTVDGKEFARATAYYTEEELNKRQARNNRRHGKI